MSLFWRYVKEHRKVMLAFCLFCLVFGVVFAMYRLPIGAVIYPALLCGLFGVLFLIFDFYTAKQKHKALDELSKRSAAMIGDLPDTGRIDDADYAAVIRSLQSEVATLETVSSAKYNEMIEYYTIWAHQIKTPIASMRLNLQNTDTAESRKLQADLFRIEQYVEMVLAFLRLDSEASDYVFKEQPLDPIIRQAVKKFSTEFIGRKISLEYEPITETIVTDEKWLSFVLEQIISNALKYTRAGSVKIEMRAPKTLCVEDTGIGIAPEDLPRIFEKGYTGYNGRTDKKASGIGLYLCKRVCDNLGIQITAKSEIGKGTIIALSLGQYEMKKE